MINTTVIFGLGSNVGSREENLRAAIDALSGFVTNMRSSRLYESKALLPEGAPDDWSLPFLNMAAIGETYLSPQEIFKRIKIIENDIGRKKRGIWAPREIDIDILCMGGIIVDTPELSIPHKEMKKRDFVLLPLAEIAPGWRCPKSNLSISEIISAGNISLGDNLRIYEN